MAEGRLNAENPMFRFRSTDDCPVSRFLRFGACALALLVTASVGPAFAQNRTYAAPVISPVPPVPAGFDITGFIQRATLDTSGAICNPSHPRLAGGTVVLNGQLIVIPCNTVLQMPAFTLSWADLFNSGTGLAPASIAPAGQTGLALGDRVGPVSGAKIPLTTAGLLTMAIPAETAATRQTRLNASLPSYEIRVVGNVVKGRYIAGLVFISQQSLNAAQGVISCINYGTGELQVGGVPVDPATTSACPDPVPLGVARVRINDTIGRYGKKHAATGQCGGAADCVEQPGYDPRFAPDVDNPTITASSGFPMCIPRMNPFTSGTDPLCPQSNRPLAPFCQSYADGFGIPPFPPQTSGYCSNFVMDAPNRPGPAGLACPGPGCPTDPTRQAPLQVGDMISFKGTLKADSKGVYVSAHTIGANLGIYTQPNTKPAYVVVEEVLAGTAALPVAGLAQETTQRIRVVGFTTDPTNLVDIYAIDQDPLTGQLGERHLATLSPMATAQLGRFRTPGNFGGVFLPPTRMYRAISRTMCAERPTGPYSTCALERSGTTHANTFANGLVAGQFSLPNFNFIFPENLSFGQALVPNNFQDLPFLYCGSGPLDGPDSSSPVVAQLDPAPWGTPMQDPIFRSTLCPQVKQVAAPLVFPVVTGAPDTVRIVAAAWDNQRSNGKINLVVTSSVSPAPPDMFMTATISNSWMTPTAPGGTENPIVAQLSLVSNTLAEPRQCPTSAPCWSLSAPGFIVDPGVAPFLPELVPPTSIVVRSSKGGTATVAEGAIRLIGCQSTTKFTCP
jgi:hypothetical protein